MVTSRNTNESTSAIEISPDTGVWIGSGKGVRIFSGGFSYDADSNILTKTNASGASVELNDQHLILGYMNTSTNAGNAIELDKDKVVIASGSAVVGNKNVTGVNGGLIGAKFTKDSIGMAVQTTGNDPVITAFLMNQQGFTVGSGGVNVTSTTAALRNLTNGSYTRIAPEGIELGSLANLYVNMDNFKL